MKHLFSFLMAFVAVALMSCGGNGNGEGGQVSSIPFEGDGNIISYKGTPILEAIDAQVTLEATECKSGNVHFTEDRPILRVTYKMLNKLTVEPDVSLCYLAVDADGSKIKDLKFSFHWDYDQKNKIENFLKNESVGSTVTIRLKTAEFHEMHKVFHIDKITCLRSDDYTKVAPK